MTFKLESPAFQWGGEIPRKHTCDGADSSPALRWNEPPYGTRSLALIVDDPDAPVGTWTHWLLYDLPPAARELPEGTPGLDTLAGGAMQGINDFRRIGYGGPCPPSGKPHRYFFKLHALDTPLNLKPGAQRRELEKAMEGHVLARAELVGRYKR